MLKLQKATCNTSSLTSKRTKISETERILCMGKNRSEMQEQSILCNAGVDPTRSESLHHIHWLCTHTWNKIVQVARFDLRLRRKGTHTLPQETQGVSIAQTKHLPFGSCGGRRPDRHEHNWATEHCSLSLLLCCMRAIIQPNRLRHILASVSKWAEMFSPRHVYRWVWAWISNKVCNKYTSRSVLVVQVDGAVRANSFRHEHATINVFITDSLFWRYLESLCNRRRVW